MADNNFLKEVFCAEAGLSGLGQAAEIAGRTASYGLMPLVRGKRYFFTPFLSQKDLISRRLGDFSGKIFSGGHCADAERRVRVESGR